MADETVSKAHLRINHVDETIYEIKDDVKENSRLIHNVSIDVAGIKTLLKVGIPLVLGALGTIIALAIGNLFN